MMAKAETEELFLQAKDKIHLRPEGLFGLGLLASRTFGGCFSIQRIPSCPVPTHPPGRQCSWSEDMSVSVLCVSPPAGIGLVQSACNHLSHGSLGGVFMHLQPLLV